MARSYESEYSPDFCCPSAWPNAIVRETADGRFTPAGNRIRQGAAEAMPDEDAVAKRRTRELRTFLFLTVILAPALLAAIVGGYGFLIWMYQLIEGPPTY